MSKLAADRLDLIYKKCELGLEDIAEIKKLREAGGEPFFPGAGAVEIYAPELKELLDNYRPIPSALTDGQVEALKAARQVVFDFEIDGLRLSSSIPILREKLIPFNGPEDNQRTLKYPPTPDSAFTTPAQAEGETL